MSFKDNPEISVIMSVYNCEKTVRESIYSILNQSIKNFEFLIADDGSSDQTASIVKSIDDDRISFFQNKENRGLLQTWNNLIDRAKGKFIIFQDGDDISLPERLEILYQFLIKNHDVAICGANFVRYFPQYRQFYRSNYPVSYSEIVETINNGSVPFIRGMFNREIVIAEGKFRRYFDRIGWEDYDLFLRIAEKYQVRNVNDVLYDYKYYVGSSSKMKVTDKDVVKLNIHQIGLFLRSQRIKNNGLDGISSQRLLEELNQFIKTKEVEYLSNKSLVYRKMALNQISNKDYNNALRNIFRAVSSKKISTANYKLLFVLSKSLVKSLLTKFKIL
jgi:glycosyltransferase involved in cell wall biosynthesis